MLIILEGADGAGKTTLAHALASEIKKAHPAHRVVMMKAGPPMKHPLDEYVLPLLSYRPGQGVHIICDRWHLGELVYPYVLGRDTRMDAAVTSYVDAFLDSRGAFIALVAPNFETVMRQLHGRGTNSIPMTDEQIAIAYWRFHDVANTRHLLGVEGTFGVTPILNGAHAREAFADRHGAHFITHVGSSHPTALLFGDVRACLGSDCKHRIRHSPRGPAFMPYPATSGHYLFRTLQHVRDQCSCSNELWAYANACDVDDAAKLWKELGEPDVIALGQRAHQRLRAHGIKHAAVPHPQFVRRFHHAESRTYARLINEVIGTDRKELKWPVSSTTPRDSGPTPTSSSKS